MPRYPPGDPPQRPPGPVAIDRHVHQPPGCKPCHDSLHRVIACTQFVETDEKSDRSASMIDDYHPLCAG